MTDVVPTDNVEPATVVADVKPVVQITVSTPDMWTIRHWQIFMNARAKYIDSAKAKGDVPIDMLADAMGGFGLIKAGVVRITGPERLSTILEKAESDPDLYLPVVGLVYSKVVVPLVTAINLPLDFLNG